MIEVKWLFYFIVSMGLVYSVKSAVDQHYEMERAKLEVIKKHGLEVIEEFSGNGNRRSVR